MSPAVFLGIVRSRAERSARPFPSIDNPRVTVHPSADGTVLLVGTTIKGRWVAEYRCLAEDFDDRCVTAMERRVRAKERGQIEVMR